MQKSVVSIVKGTDATKMVEEALSLLGGVNSLIKPNSTVVVKPNAGHYYPPESSVNTSPAMVTAIIKVLRKARPRQIILAESSAISFDTLKCLEVSGITKAAEDAGVDRIIDIKKEKDLINIPIRDARSALTKTAFPRFLLEADHIVNLPIFKTHSSTVFTGALKNMEGIVQDKVHFQVHQTDLAAAMLDIWSVVKADLSIVDVIRPAVGFGPHSATYPTYVGCVVAGKDPVAVDATICRIVDLDIDKVPYFESAWERGLGNFAEDTIEIRGRTIREVFKPIWIPYLEGFDAWPEYNILSQDSCSCCQGLVAATMEWLRAIGEYDKNRGITIVLGPEKELPKGIEPKNLILVGDCLKEYRGQGIYAGGCPPFAPLPLWAIIHRRDYAELEDFYREGVAPEEVIATEEIFKKYVDKIVKLKGVD